MNFCQGEQIINLLKQISVQLEAVQKGLDAVEGAVIRLSLSVEDQNSTREEL